MMSVIKFYVFHRENRWWFLKQSVYEGIGVSVELIGLKVWVIKLTQNLLLLILIHLQNVLQPQISYLRLAAHLERNFGLQLYSGLSRDILCGVDDIVIIMVVESLFCDGWVGLSGNVFFLASYDSVREFILFFELLMVAPALNACFCFDILLHLFEKCVGPKSNLKYFRTSLDFTFCLFIYRK